LILPHIFFATPEAPYRKGIQFHTFFENLGISREFLTDSSLTAMLDAKIAEFWGFRQQRKIVVYSDVFVLATQD